jgi:endonuclease YncB( thermonuclease family)
MVTVYARMGDTSNKRAQCGLDRLVPQGKRTMTKKAKLPVAVAATLVLAAGASTAFKTSYVGEVVRVIDGDTVEAKIEVLPGMTYTVDVRERDLDTPEKRRGRGGAQCDEEIAQGKAVSKLVSDLLPAGTKIGIENVGLGKYAGRFIGDIKLVIDDGSAPVDLGDWLIGQGLAVNYDGGTKRKVWCPINVKQDRLEKADG